MLDLPDLVITEKHDCDMRLYETSISITRYIKVLKKIVVYFR